MPHARLSSDPPTLSAYDDLGVAFDLLRQMLTARAHAGLSQTRVAGRMGTKAGAITRLQSPLQSGRHSPTPNALRRPAEAVGCGLQIALVPSLHTTTRSSVDSPGAAG